MERIALAALAVASAAWTGACWTGGSTPAAAPAPAMVRERPPLELSLARGPCFGTCPVFEVAIRDDGRVEWLGKAHVAVLGLRTRQIERAALDALDRELEAARFFDRDPAGHLPRKPSCVRRGNTMSCSFVSETICSDTSHTILTVRRGDRTHRIENAHCSDEDTALAALEAEILERAGVADWIGP